MQDITRKRVFFHTSSTTAKFSYETKRCSCVSTIVAKREIYSIRFTQSIKFYVFKFKYFVRKLVTVQS